MIRHIFLIIAFLLSSCSTVEKETFFTPSPIVGAEVTAPKLSCGMFQSNKFANEISYNQLIYNAHQSTEPYLFGPWLVTVIPIFPITWGVDLFSSSNLELLVRSSSSPEQVLKGYSLEIVVTLSNGEVKKLSPNNLITGKSSVRVIYPIKASSVVSFSIKTADGENTINFTSNTRWSWVQYCVNN